MWAFCAQRLFAAALAVSVGGGVIVLLLGVGLTVEALIDDFFDGRAPEPRPR